MTGAKKTGRRPAAAGGGMMARIRARLGRADMVTVSDVVAACAVSTDTVYTWIEAGEIEAANLAPRGKRAYYQIYAPSVLAFYERRMG